MRILWHSNAGWNFSGYGKMTALFVPRIANLDGYEITGISAPYSFGGNLLEWQGIKTFPCARDSAGNDTIATTHEYTEADLTLTLCDVFGLLKAAQAGVLSQIPLAHWFPVDTDSRRGAGHGSSPQRRRHPYCDEPFRPPDAP